MAVLVVLKLFKVEVTTLFFFTMLKTVWEESPRNSEEKKERFDNCCRKSNGKLKRGKM